MREAEQVAHVGADGFEGRSADSRAVMHHMEFSDEDFVKEASLDEITHRQ